MSAVQPVETGCAQSQKGNSEGAQRGMTLALRDGDQNWNAFAESSSSSSSPSCQGESSPDSVRSSSSLSSGRSDSPVDVDMQECTEGHKVLAGCDGQVEITKKISVLEPDNVLQQRDCSESNDNSVYLDARDNEDDTTWNNNESLALVFIQEDTSHDHGDVHGNHNANQIDCRRRYSDDSQAPLCSSENDEIGDEDDDEDQEDSFLSVSSGDMVMRSNSTSLNSSERALSGVSLLANSSTSSSDQEPLPSLSCLSSKKTQGLGSAHLATSVCPEGQALTEEPQKKLVDVPGKESEEVDGEAQEGTAELGSTSVTDETRVETPGVQSKDPHEVETSTPVGGVASTSTVRKTKEPVTATRGKQTSSATKSTVTKSTKPGKNEVKTFPKPDLKNVKSKIMSRPPSATRLTRNEQQARGKNATSQSSPCHEKKPPATAPRPAQNKQDGTGGDLRRTSSFCQLRGAGPKPAVAHGADQNARAAPQRLRRKPSMLRQAPEVLLSDGPRELCPVEEPGPDSEGQKGTRAEGAGEAARPGLPEGPDPAAAKEQSAEPRGDSDQTVSSKLGPKTGLPTAAASATGASATSESVPPSASLVTGATPGTSAASRTKAGVGTSATSSRDVRTTAENVSPPRVRQVQAAGIPKMRVPDRSLATSQPAPPAASKPSQNPPGLGITRLPSSSKLPVKGLPTSLSSSSLGSTTSETSPNPTARAPNSAPGAKITGPDEKPSRPASSAAPQAPNKPPAPKPVGMRNRTTSIPGKSSIMGPKTPAVAKPTQSPLQRSASTRISRASASVMVDKNKPKPAAPAPAPVSSPATLPVPVASARAAGTQASGQSEPPAPVEEKPLDVAHYWQQCERKNQCIQQLRKLLLSGNRRLEALALVVQHIFTEREEALKQKKDLTGELSAIRQELVGSTASCERLEKEKEEARLTFEETLQKLRQEHQAELTQLEERLRAFYSAEWDKTHQAYQEEADKCQALMQQQVEEILSKQEALRQEQEVNHAQQMEALKQQYETTLQELQKTHEQNMNAMEKTLKDSEASLSRQIEELAMENNELKTKLQAEEERRRILAEKSQKDAHTLYLEQELESLKVVLEIKTQQLHQQDKKLMQMDKLVETNVKLEECLNKVQQENEDYKARMDKHAALSRQLSTEQAMLQQTLQKESKVNKRLSMENEELLWKLHNSDMSSPRRLSPTSPFHSPRNSTALPTAPLSPR